MLSRSFTLNKCVVILVRYYANEALHFLNCCVHNSISIHGSIKLFTIIDKVFAKDQDLWHLVNAEFFTKLLFLETINCTNFNHTVQFLCNRHILILEGLALLKFRVKEVDYPNLLSAVKRRNLSEVETDYI